MPQRRNVVLDAIADAARMASIIQRGRAQQQAQAVREQRLADTQRIKEDDRFRQTQLDEDKRIRDSKTDLQTDEDREMKFLESGAIRLNPSQSGFLEQERAGELGGAHVRIPLTEGVSARARGQSVFRGGEEFFIPRKSDVFRRDLAQDLEKETKTLDVKRLAKQGQEERDLSTKKSQEGRNLATKLALEKRTLATTLAAEKRSTKSGKTGASRAQVRLEKKDENQAYIAAEASRIWLDNDGDADKALKDIPRQSRFDETGRLRKNAVAIAKFIKTLQENPDRVLETLRLIFEDDIPPELLSGGQPGAASPEAGGSAAAAQQEALRFLKKRRK